MKKRYYYKFWITSSRGTDKMTVRMYEDKPDEYTLESDCKDWASLHPCWGSSENVINYGWKELKHLPKTREEAVNKFMDACKKYGFWEEKRKLWAALLCHPPYDGKV